MSFPRPSIRGVVLALVALGLLAAAVFLVRSRSAASANLRDVAALLAQQRFDEVEQRLQRYMRDRPDDANANILMAQVALARPDQKPEVALRHLGRVRLRDGPTLAIVRLNEGKAYSALGRYVDAERAWLDALRIDPVVPEAGWALLGLYYIQGRRDDAHDLAMKLREKEPDRRDRAQLLLELLRQDAKSLVFETLVPVLTPVVQNHPDDVYSAIALARALIRSSQADQGLEILNRLVERLPDNAAARDALLAGLDESFRYDELEQELGRLPPSLAAVVRLDKYRGAVAQSKQNWPEAAALYRRALADEPHNGEVLYRLCQNLRTARKLEDADVLEARRKVIESARKNALPLYEEANKVPGMGVQPHTDLYQRLADVREQMGRPDEAIAWHKLVLADEPENRISRGALERLAAKHADLGADPALTVRRP
jgi:tetratricopeptide (TPR) repeat protein